MNNLEQKNTESLPYPSSFKSANFTRIVRDLVFINNIVLNKIPVSKKILTKIINGMFLINTPPEPNTNMKQTKKSEEAAWKSLECQKLSSVRIYAKKYIFGNFWKISRLS